MLHNRFFSLCVLLVLSLFFGCGTSPPVIDAQPRAIPAPAASSAPSSDIPVKKTTLEEVGLDSSIMDRSVSPCDDFYQFACGAWLKRTTLADDQDVWTRSFSEMAKTIETNVKTMLEEFADPTNGARSDKAKMMLGDFYASCMDEEAIDRLKTAPIDDLLARIEHAKTRGDLGQLLMDLHLTGVYALVRLSADVDRRDTSKIVGDIWKNGWELSHDEYVKTDRRSTDIRNQYEKTLRAMVDASATTASARDRRVRNTIAIETLLSEQTAVEKASVDSWKDAKRWTASDLAREAPGFPWKEYLGAAHVSPDSALNVLDPEGIKRISDVVQKQSMEALRDYLYTRTLFDMTYVLSRPFREAKFALRSVRWGTKKEPPRFQACIRTTQYTFGDALVGAYAERYHFDKNDPVVIQMTKDIYEAWGERLNDVSWLDDVTRKGAIEKLNNITYHIGYPDKAAEPISLDRKAFATNMFRADRARKAKALTKVGSAPDRDEWTRSPLEANAYHDHERNSIFIHLAMLMSPIYNPKASVPVQFGTLGMTLGHELGHGFDQHGSNFDAHGIERNWWTDQTKHEFDKREQCFVDQFSTLDIFPDLKVNGKLSVGENIADVAGLRVAFRAYRKHQANEKERLVANGFSEDQQFFLSRAQSWCTVMTDAGARSSNERNPHIYPKWAVNGPLHHLTEFHQAFSCKAPADMCTLW